MSFRAEGALCAVIIRYVKPLEAVDAEMKEHVAWLKQGFAHGVLLLAGRQEPRTGGVLISRGTHDEIAALAATDPFVTSGVATVEVIQFNASFAAPEIAALLA